MWWFSVARLQMDNIYLCLHNTWKFNVISSLGPAMYFNWANTSADTAPGRPVWSVSMANMSMVTIICISSISGKLTSWVHWVRRWLEVWECFQWFFLRGNYITPLVRCQLIARDFSVPTTRYCCDLGIASVFKYKKSSTGVCVAWAQAVDRSHGGRLFQSFGSPLGQGGWWRVQWVQRCCWCLSQWSPRYSFRRSLLVSTLSAGAMPRLVITIYTRLFL